jgi:mannose-6-phosphate isomerase
MNNEFGGNITRAHPMNSSGKRVFSEGSYEYYMYKSSGNEELIIEGLESACLLVKEKSDHCMIHLANLSKNLSIGDVVVAEGHPKLILNISGGDATILVTGVRGRSKLEKSIAIKAREDIYRVNKPWGFEMWLNGDHPLFVFKEIFIKKGTKTSLQFHKFKKETNVLFSGDAILHFKKNSNKENLEVAPEDIGNVSLSPITSIDVEPNVIHRIEAESDILLFEVSTPYLDDVIRLMDDSQRPNGRINQEHSSASQ